jgi:hypothetical protein
MRSIKELLMVMLDHQDKFKSGLCNWVFELNKDHILTNRESTRLDNYISYNKPKWYSSYSALKAKNTEWYWIRTNKAPRIRWIKKHIKLNQ